MRSGGGGSALVAGASIAAVELPTAAPYFAVIAAIVAWAPEHPADDRACSCSSALAFVAPLIAIVVVLLVAGERADPALRTFGAWLQRHWPEVLAAVLLLVGVGLTVAGAKAILAVAPRAWSG